MKFFNKTKGILICEDLYKAVSIKDRVLGLLDKKLPRNILLQTRFGIHTFGLDVPIDVLVLNSGYKVVKVKKSLKPNRVFFWNSTFDLLVELEAGLITKRKIEVGDFLKIN